MSRASTNRILKDIISEFNKKNDKGKKTSLPTPEPFPSYPSDGQPDTGAARGEPKPNSWEDTTFFTTRAAVQETIQKLRKKHHTKLTQAEQNLIIDANTISYGKD